MSGAAGLLAWPEKIVEELKAGFAIPEWCLAVGIGRSNFYVLPGQLRPRSVKIGKRHIIIEAPKDYLERIAAQSQVAA